MWKEEEAGDKRVNAERFAEAKATLQSADSFFRQVQGFLAVGCPFCLAMLSDASKADGGQVQVQDVAELVATRLKS